MKHFNFKTITAFTLLIFLGYSTAIAQEDSKEKSYSFSVNADFVSRYVWRGLQLGGMSVQPSMEFSKGNFAVGSFGSYSFTDATYLQEADLYVAYTVADMLTFTFSDYYFPVDFATKSTHYNYFEFRPDSTGHIFEPMLSFDGAAIDIPVSFLIGVNAYGADFRKLNGDLNYSTYAELAYNKTYHDTDLSLFTGFSITTPGDGLTSFYGNTDPAFVNIGLTLSKEIKNRIILSTNFGFINY